MRNLKKVDVHRLYIWWRFNLRLLASFDGLACLHHNLPHLFIQPAHPTTIANIQTDGFNFKWLKNTTNKFQHVVFNRNIPSIRACFNMMQGLLMPLSAAAIFVGNIFQSDFDFDQVLHVGKVVSLKRFLIKVWLDQVECLLFDTRKRKAVSASNLSYFIQRGFQDIFYSSTLSPQVKKNVSQNENSVLKKIFLDALASLRSKLRLTDQTQIAKITTEFISNNHKYQR